MSGYTATARLNGANVHAGTAIATGHDMPERLDLGAASLVDPETGDPIIPEATMDDRIHYVRQAWAQTTFFLFDPQSWR